MLAAILARWRPRVKLGEISAANRRDGECAIGAPPRCPGDAGICHGMVIVRRGICGVMIALGPVRT
jgi:phage baseplate assembly protein W